jgi:L-fucose isomerase-like protein
MLGITMFSKPKVYVMPIGSITSPDVRSDYESLVGTLKKLDAELVIGSPLNDEVSILERIEEVRKYDFDASIVLSLHGFTGHLQALFVDHVKLPTVIWTLPSRYSFPTAASAVGYLRERGLKVRLIHSPPTDLSVLKDIEEFIKVAALLRRLSNVRIGVVGGIIPPMVASHYDRTILKDRFGVDVVHIPLNEVMNSFNNVRDDEVNSKLSEVRSKYVLEAPEEGVKKALKLYLAIKKIQEVMRLDAIALECYTELFQLFNVNPCLGFIDDQIIGCEGEVLNVVGLLIARYLSGRSALISDPFSVSRDGVLTFMHCAAPASVAEDSSKVHIVSSEPPSIIRYRIPVVHCRPEIPLTTVTIFRIYGKLIDKVHVTIGNVVSYGISNALQIRVRIDNPSKFLEEVVGNHYVIAFGDIRGGLKLFSKWLGLNYIET